MYHQMQKGRGVNRRSQENSSEKSSTEGGGKQRSKTGLVSRQTSQWQPDEGDWQDVDL